MWQCTGRVGFVVSSTLTYNHSVDITLLSRWSLAELIAARWYLLACPGSTLVFMFSCRSSKWFLSEHHSYFYSCMQRSIGGTQLCFDCQYLFLFLSQRYLLSLFFFFLYIPHWLCTFPSHVWNAWLNDLSARLCLMRWAAPPKLLLLLLRLSNFSFWKRVRVSCSMGESLAPEFRNLLNSLLLFFSVKCDNKPLFDCLLNTLRRTSTFFANLSVLPEIFGERELLGWRPFHSSR